MSLRDWLHAVRPWLDAIRDLLIKPPSEPPKDEDGKYLPPQTKKRRFVPPRSLPDSELPPKWPDKSERK